MNDYDDSLYNYLKKNLKICKLTTNKQEFSIRCPFCGDSIKDSKSSHLYISNFKPHLFHCFKCETSGIFNNKVLLMLNLFNNEISNILTKNFQDYKKNLNVKYGNKFDKYFTTKSIIFYPSNFTDNELKKVDYLEKRLGITLKDEDLERYKIILNLEDFININNIKTNRSNYELNNIEDLSKNFIGFLLNDKNMMCFRNINNGSEIRYKNFKLFNEDINFSRKFYTIKNDIDLSNSIFNIYLTEGIFDILGVFNHIYNCKLNNNDLFIGCNGKSYNFVLNYLKTLSILNCDINIYSDNDVNKNFFERLKNNNQLLKFNGFNLIYNLKNKDFGVQKNLISINKIKL